MKTTTCLTLVLLVVGWCQATTLPQLELNDLIEDVDIVAIVRIEAGSVVGKPTDHCGAEYRGRVTTAIKGTELGDILVFGPYIGLGVGEEYMVFLTTDRDYNPRLTSFSLGLSLPDPCAGLHPENRITFDGMSTLEIGRPHQFEYSQAVRFHTELLVPPKGLPTEDAVAGDDRIIGPEVWVPRHALVEYLLERQRATIEEAPETPKP